MASLIDFDVDPDSGEKSSEAGVLEKCIIDLAIERQLNELLKIQRSTDSSSTTCSNTTTCLLDLDQVGAADEKREPVQQKDSIDSTFGQLISNYVPTTTDELINNNVTSDKLVAEHESPSTNKFELLASELKKTAIVIPEKSTVSTQPKETIIVYSNPISWMFEYASKQKLKHPHFVQENLGQTFKVTCSFAGVEGEGKGRSVKIAKLQSAEECLKNFNSAMLNNQPIDRNEFKKEPDMVIKQTNVIGQLYEHAAKFLNARPRFESSEKIGLYTVTCSYLTYSESSTDKSKQKAKTDAASKVYEKLVTDSYFKN